MRANMVSPSFRRRSAGANIAFPRGLHFGGFAESWSHKMLRAILGEDLPGVKKLVAIDFHTGLGEAGAAEMIVEAAPATPIYQRARAIWGGRAVSSEAGESHASVMTGTLDQALAAWLAKAELTFAVLEVGTAPFQVVFNALRRDNWLHNFSSDQELAEEVRSACRAAFYPRPEGLEAAGVRPCPKGGQ